jgi:hypothetical protein
VQTVTGPHVVLKTAEGGGVWSIGTAYFRSAPTRGAAWAPDGRLAFVAGTPTRIAVYDFSTTKMTSFRVDSAASLRWSPDGTWIVFSDAHGLSQLSVATGVVSQIPEGSDADWSPDSSQLAFSAVHECGDRAGIYANGMRITNDCRVLGTEGPDTMRASNTLFEIVMGLGGDDTLIGRGAPYIGDELDGGDGNDRIVGGPLPDRLFGDPGDDTLMGGPGPDTLNGGPGHDTLLGGGGRDTIYANDGEPDAVDCGTNTGVTNKNPENDKAYVDRFDVVTHCERVFRSP